MSNGNHALSYPKQRRSRQKKSVDVGESDNLEAQSNKSDQPEDNGQSIAVPKRSRRNNRGTCISSTTSRMTRSSVNTCPVLTKIQKENYLIEIQIKKGSGDDVLNCSSTEMNGKMISTSIMGPEAAMTIATTEKNANVQSGAQSSG